MLHITKNGEKEYFSIKEFWEPYRELSDILQPWKQTKYWKSASHPLVMFTLIELFKEAIQHEGSVAEFGVWQGGSAILLAKEMIGTKKRLHLLDTFEGIPSTSEKDNFWKTGDFGNTNLEAIQMRFNQFDFVSIHKGEFSDTFSEIENERFCFVHIDSDTYDSVRKVTEFVYPKMKPGGMIVYDDYGDWVSQGARQAVDEFYKSIKKNFIYLPSKQAVVLCF